MQNAIAQIRSFLAGLTNRQKLTIGFSGVVMLAAIGGLVWFASKPEYTVLVSGLQGTSAQSVSGRLSAKNIHYRLSADGGSLEVPSDQLDAARVEIASSGMPKEARLGFEIFDKPNWAASEFSEKVNYQRAIEGELERTISTIEDVESARVHLVLPTESLFSERDRRAKASVLLRMRAPSPSKQMLESVTRLVASAVDGLEPAAVSIMDAESGRSFTARSETDWSHASPLDQELTERLLATLEPIVGMGHVKVSVRVETEVSTVDENQESFDPNSSVAVTTQRSEERTGGTLASGVPGTSSNLPNAQGGQEPPTSEDSSQMSKTESNTYAVNRLVRHTQLPPGRVRRVSAAVLVDDALAPDSGKTNAQQQKKRSAEELKQIEELARATLGMDAARGDVLTVQNIAFTSMPTETIVPMNAPQKVRKIVNEWSIGIRYLVIFVIFVLIYIFMFRPFRRQLSTAIQMSAEAMSRSRKSQAVVELGDAALELDAAKSPEIKRAAVLKKELGERIKAEPASATRLLQNWIGEDAG